MRGWERTNLAVVVAGVERGAGAREQRNERGAAVAGGCVMQHLASLVRHRSAAVAPCRTDDIGWTTDVTEGVGMYQGRLG